MTSDAAIAARVREGYLGALDDDDDPRSVIGGLLDREAPLLDHDDARRIAARVESQVRGLGVIEELWGDPDITDVLINGPGPIWVERRGRLERTSWSIHEPELSTVIERVFGRVGVRLDRAQPIADGRLADGSRISAVLPPVALAGPVVSIRRFAIRAFELDAYASPLVVALIDEVLAARSNLVVHGGTGSGKTSLLNAIAGRFHPNERIVTVEDAAELRLPGRHVVALEARRANSEGAGRTTITDLVRAVLRLRPDRIVVGEVRGPEALDMIWAMSSGHDGSMSTLHAASAADALLRLETFVAMGSVAVPVDGMRRQIGSAVDLLVGVERRDDGSRRITSIDEVVSEGTVPMPRPLVRGELIVGAITRSPRRTRP